MSLTIRMIDALTYATDNVTAVHDVTVRAGMRRSEHYGSRKPAERNPEIAP